MKADEVANKFQSASATCRGNKCPYAAECKGTRETCKMREIALLIRTMANELVEVHAQYDALSQGAKVLVKYIVSLEKINAEYYKMIRKFQDGYRPSNRIKKGVPHIGSGRKKKPPEEMDGDKRYAMPEDNKKEKRPVVII